MLIFVLLHDVQPLAVKYFIQLCIRRRTWLWSCCGGSSAGLPEGHLPSGKTFCGCMSRIRKAQMVHRSPHGQELPLPILRTPGRVSARRAAVHEKLPLQARTAFRTTTPSPFSCRRSKHYFFQCPWWSLPMNRCPHWRTERRIGASFHEKRNVSYAKLSYFLLTARRAAIRNFSLRISLYLITMMRST